MRKLKVKGEYGAWSVQDLQDRNRNKTNVTSGFPTLLLRSGISSSVFLLETEENRPTNKHAESQTVIEEKEV